MGVTLGVDASTGLPIPVGLLGPGSVVAASTLGVRVGPGSRGTNPRLPPSAGSVLDDELDAPRRGLSSRKQPAKVQTASAEQTLCVSPRPKLSPNDLLETQSIVGTLADLCADPKVPLAMGGGGLRISEAFFR
jgi:hypothetical protein